MHEKASSIIEDRKELSEQTKREIAKARKEIAKGKFSTLSQIKKKHNLK